jgi:hypothetical protein
MKFAENSRTSNTPIFCKIILGHNNYIGNICTCSDSQLSIIVAKYRLTIYKEEKFILAHDFRDFSLQLADSVASGPVARQ